eukprot:snap_masked-scaffold_11-processed-gene-7.36-mRNA-1 protein AED:1.00 eAED:1.00 QI:0/0/0/0/1/1/2/0/189
MLSLNISHFSDSFTSFISSSPKQVLSLQGFLTNELLEDFTQSMKRNNKFINFITNTSILNLSANKFFNIPSGFLSNNIFNFSAEKNVVLLEENNQLQNIEKGSFEGHNNSKFSCKKMTQIPDVLNKLNLISLDLSETGLENLNNLEFRSDSAFVLNLNNTWVEPFCTELDAFRENWSIPEAILFETCKY